MAERSYPRDFVGLLPDESARWVQQGLISEEQRGSILKLYPEPAAAGRDRTVLIFSILGSLLLAAGVVLFFAANWPRIPATVKVAAIMVAIVATYGVGYYLAYKRDDYPRLGQALIFLGGLFYGAGIWLIAQIFHLDSHWPNGFLLWGAGVLPIAWATSSSPLLYLSTGLLTVWTVSEQASFDAYNYLYPLLLLGVVLPLSRRLGTWLAEGAALAGLFLWFAINVPARQPGHGSPGDILLIARQLILYGLAVAAGGLAGLGDLRAYLSVGVIGTLGGAYMLTFNTISRYNPQPYVMPSLFGGSPYVIAGSTIFLLAALAAGYLYVRRGGRDLSTLLPAMAVFALASLLAGFAGNEVGRMIAFNLLLFGGTVGLIVLGIQRRTAWVVNLGLIIFVIHVLTRYFDLFFSAMNKSVFFMVGGVLLLGGGWLLERNRRRWVGGMGGDGGVR